MCRLKCQHTHFPAHETLLSVGWGRRSPGAVRPRRAPRSNPRLAPPAHQTGRKEPHHEFSLLLRVHRPGNRPFKPTGCDSGELLPPSGHPASPDSRLWRHREQGQVPRDKTGGSKQTSGPHREHGPRSSNSDSPATALSRFRGTGRCWVTCAPSWSAEASSCPA